MRVRAPRAAELLARRKLVYEQTEHRANLKMKMLQRLYDRTPFWEKYLDGTLEIHAHAQVGEFPVCFQVSADRVFGHPEDAGHVEVHAYRENLPVLGGVIDVPKGSRPLAAFERLKLANDCHVFLADAYEESRAPTREALGRVLYRELCSSLGGSGVVFCEDVDQVVEGGPEIAGNLSDQDTGVHSRRTKDVRWGEAPPSQDLPLQEHRFRTVD